MPDVITFGELLIDFVPTTSGVTLAEALAFNKLPGGAPANVAVGLTRLGVSSGFMGMVGDDPFGIFLAQTLVREGVDTSNLLFSGDAHTMLAFVSLSSEGERDFLFYRHPSADMLFSPEDINQNYLQSARIFHYGSISLINEPSRSATIRAIDIVQDAGLLISYDPNLRLGLWPGETSARKGILSVWDMAHIVKVSEDEIKLLSGELDVITGARKLWGKNNQVIIVTQGKQGCMALTPDDVIRIPGFDVQVVDTTGAGDGFVAGVLYGILEKPSTWQEITTFQNICYFANAVGALTTTRKGAIPALPTYKAVKSFLAGKS